MWMSSKNILWAICVAALAYKEMPARCVDHTGPVMIELNTGDIKTFAAAELGNSVENPSININNISTTGEGGYELRIK